MKILSVGLVLSLFSLAVKLLKRIEKRDSRASIEVTRQIYGLRSKQIQLDESALKASRVAEKLRTLVA